MLPKPYYEEKGITIYHGDCREILPNLGKFDLCLTDPPYGIFPEIQKGDGRGWGGFANGEHEDAQGWDSLFSEIDKVVKSANRAMIWGGNYYELSPSRCWLVWAKPDAVETQASIELCWTNFDKNAKHLVLTRNPPKDKKHPTQKPLRLIKWCITQAGDVKTIIDPFMGSGTTLRAAKDLGLSATGIELDERYCEIAANRLRQEVLSFEKAA